MRPNNQSSFNQNSNDKFQNPQMHNKPQGDRYDFYHHPNYSTPQSQYGYNQTNNNFNYQMNANQQQHQNQQYYTQHQYYSQYNNNMANKNIPSNQQPWNSYQYNRHSQQYHSRPTAAYQRQTYQIPQQQQSYKMAPQDPRKKQTGLHKNRQMIIRSEEVNQQKKQAYKHKSKNQDQSQISSQQADSLKQSQSEEQDEEQLYQKTKAIYKKRDPILDTPQQIKKWVEARRRNYPISGKQKTQSESIQQQMSILETKIRKKILLLSADGKGLMKKLKNMHILKRLVIEPNAQSYKRKQNSSKGRQDKLQHIKKLKQRKLKELKGAQQLQEMKKIAKTKQDENYQENQDQEIAIQMPIKKQANQNHNNIQPSPQIFCEEGELQPSKGKRPTGLTPEDMIAHLKQKQEQDKQFYNKLLDYKTNSLNYKYTSQTLETNFLIEDIFQQSSYLLQIIRHIAKNNFFDSK